jgi:hypothetical protein
MHCCVACRHWSTNQLSKNKLTVAVLELCSLLVSFGAFGSVSSVVSMISSLISVLNGTSDLISPDDVVSLELASLLLVSVCTAPDTRTYHSRCSGQPVAAGDLHPTERYEVMARDSVVMQAKTLICDIINQIMDIDMEMRLSVYVTQYNRGDFDESPSSQPVARLNVSEYVLHFPVFPFCMSVV